MRRGDLSLGGETPSAEKQSGRDACQEQGFSTSSCFYQIRESIVVSISACHAEDPGSIPGRGVSLFFFSDLVFSRLVLDVLDPLRVV